MEAARGDPYLWSALAALLLGLALGQALRWASTFTRRARATGKGRKSRGGRSARALALLGLAFLPATAMLVFPDKASLLDPGLLAWAGIALAIGALAGFWPRAAGLGLAAALIGALVAVDAGLSGWIDFRGPSRIASILPYELVAGEPGAGGRGASFRGELELVERDSVPVAQAVAMGSSEVAVAVESLELRGPLALAAALVGRGEGGRFYRVVGLVAPGAQPLHFPEASALLSSIAAIAPGEGLEPGAPALRSEALLGLFVRRRGASESARLIPLEPARFALDEGMEARVEGR